MIHTRINNRWDIVLPDHRARFHEERPWWEAARLSDMNAWVESKSTLVETDGVGTILAKMRETPLQILDVGSEEGDFSALYATWGCAVTCIDPSFPWMRQTVETFRANHVQRLLNGSFIGFAAEDSNWRGMKIGEDARFYTMDEPIRRVAVDDAFDIAWDAITMDVEGNELAVLKGAETKLTQTSPVVWVSIHGDVDPHAPMPSAVHEYMRSLGYKDQWLGHQHEWFYRFFRD